MDNYEFQSEPENSFHENYNLYHDKRSQSFATAGFVLGLIAALTPYFVFTSLICGPLAIIFGLLSKGGEMTMDTKGKVAVILGIIGLVLTVLILLTGCIFLDTFFLLTWVLVFLNVVKLIFFPVEDVHLFSITFPFLYLIFLSMS